MNRTTPVPRIDLARGPVHDALHGDGPYAGCQPAPSAAAVEAIGFTPAIEAALNGLTAAKLEAVDDASAAELSIGYLVAYLRHHRFSEAELIDVVWEAAATLERRGAITGGVVVGGGA